jgi:hypothetical protein
MGDRIEEEWLRSSYDEEVFPSLALRALEENPPYESLGVPEIIDWVFSGSRQIAQPSPRVLFGQPPVTLYQGPRFYIEALFWLSATTAIHEHGFSGAFAVLAGSSVHSHWHFEVERTINSRMLCGRLGRVSTEILLPGSIQQINSGSRLIHQLFHLEMPSVTIVVRTYTERNHLPQYQYMLPGLAIDPEDHDSLRTRRLIFLEGMALGQIAGLAEYSRSLIKGADLETIYYMLSLLSRRKADSDLLAEMVATANERYGDVVDLIWRVCEGERRTRVVTALRGKVVESGARFFMALLMLMPDREAILDAVRLQFPNDDPVVSIGGWLESMAEKGNIGFDLNAVNRAIFGELVAGSDSEAILRKLASEFTADFVGSNGDRLLDHARKIARSDLFSPLFSGSPLRSQAGKISRPLPATSTWTPLDIQSR